MKTTYEQCHHKQLKKNQFINQNLHYSMINEPVQRESFTGKQKKKDTQSFMYT